MSDSETPPTGGKETENATSTQFEVGLVIEDKYQILEKIGHGGMGVVYRARHTLMDREVALKVLHPHLVENEEFLRRFRHEAQVASKLNHPNAVMIYDFGIASKLPYLVMEFVQGETLKDLIAKEGPISPTKLLPIMSQVFSALEEAHRLGIVHRDLKPDNFILSRREDGSIMARVLDFGIAKLLQKSDNAQQTLATQAGAFFGTPRYASPEQALGKELDARADIYALGVILYESLSGELPFNSPSIMELLLKHLNQPPPPVRSKRPDLEIGEPVEAVVLKCLEKERDKRFQNVRALSDAFRESVIASEAKITTGSRGPILFIGALSFVILGGIAYLAITLFEGDDSHRNGSNPALSAGSSAAVIGSSSFDQELVMLVGSNVSSEQTAVSQSPQTDAEHVSQALSSLALSSVLSSVSSVESSASSWVSSEASIESVAPEATQAPTRMPTSTPSPSPTSAPKATLTAGKISITTGTPAGDTSFKDEDISIPDDPIIAYKQAEKFYRSKQYGKAIPYYESVVAKDGAYKKAWLSLGICYLRLGRMNESFKKFKAAYDIDQTYPPTLFNLACYYALNGETDSALKWLEMTIKNEPAARSWARSEPDLVSLRKNPIFQQLIR